MKRRATIGLCMLCALAFSAFAAQSASAVFSGTTAFTCKEKPEPGGAGFSKAHCKEADKVASGAKYEHVPIANDTTTDLRGSNAGTAGEEAVPTTLRSTNSGVELELKATTVSGTGSMHNHLTGEEHIATGTGVITYSGVTVTKPAGKGCKVFTDKLPGKEKGTEGVVDTRELKASTAGQGMGLKFEPAEGTVFASFIIEGCSVSAFNKTYEVTGSVVSSSIDGATVNFTETQTTGQETLKLGGQKAGIEGTLTLEATDTEIPGDVYRPLSATTTP